MVQQRRNADTSLLTLARKERSGTWGTGLQMAHIPDDAKSRDDVNILPNERHTLI